MIITDSKELKRLFVNAMEKYNQFYWAVAWAGREFDVFDKFFLNQNKIKRVVIGLHFYQTHPDFIKKAIQISGIKFIKQPEGTFHTKTYLFFNNDKEWVAFIGSANFTEAAFTENTETMIMITSANVDMLNSIIAIIDRSWEKAKSFTGTEFNRYKKIWAEKNIYARELKQPFVKREKDLAEAAVKDMTWAEFIEGIKKDKHGYKGRITMMQRVQEFFKNNNDFGAMDESTRKRIAGFAGKVDGIDWDWYGSMKGAGLFKKAVNKKDENIIMAINAIPLEGDVTHDNFNDFVFNYQKTFKKGNWIATATRLLAMKRPDIFVCLDSKNERLLSQNFAIKQTGMTYERYWEEIIGNIKKSNWWKDSTFKNDEEKEIFKYRAAFLDALYYEQ